MKRIVGAGLLGVAVFVGCGGSTGGSGDNATPIPQAQFPSELAKAVCNAIGPCCEKSGYAYDAAKCITALEAVYSQFFGGAVQYDAQKGGNCVAYAASAMKKCGGEPDPGPCEGVVSGTVPAGGQCQSSSECVEPPGGMASCNDGVCAQSPRGKLGDGCSMTCTDEGNSISCSGGGGSGGASGQSAICFTNDGFACGPDDKCVAVGKVGDPCTFGSCAASAWCDWNTSTCVARAAVGAPCSDNDACVDGAWCDGNTCAAVKADGAACADYFECASHDCDAGKCSAGSISAGMCAGTISS